MKPDIKKALTLSAKKRALLYFETVANDKVIEDAKFEVFDFEELLMLKDSFQTVEEKKLFDKYERFTINLIEYKRYISSLFLKFDGEINQINGLMLLYHNYRREEELLNNILKELPGKEKERVLRLIKEDVRRYATAVERANKNDYDILIDTDTPTDPKDPEYTSLFLLIKGWSNNAYKTMSLAKSAIAAIYEVMKQEGFVISPISHEVRRLEISFGGNWAIIPGYNNHKINELSGIKEAQKDPDGAIFIYPRYNDVKEVTTEKDSIKETLMPA